MKLVFNLIIVFFLTISCACFGQYEHLITTSTEGIHDTIIFSNCLDSIKKYVYLDSRKTKPYFSLCEKMLHENKGLTDKHKLGYVIQSIYNDFNSSDYLLIAEKIANHKYLLDSEQITSKQYNALKYLDAYISLELGDYKNAQQLFYDMTSKAEAEKDTSLFIQASGSLGELFTKSKKYHDAEKYLLKHLALIPPTHPNIVLGGYIKLIQLYIESGALNSATSYNEKALLLADSINSKDLKIELLLNSIDINTQQESYVLAEEAYGEAIKLSTEMGNATYVQNCKAMHAGLFAAKKEHKQALQIFEELIEIEKRDSLETLKLLGYYHQASASSIAIGDFQKGYEYLNSKNEIAEVLALKEQEQFSEYLNIQYEAEQKDEENLRLSNKVTQQKLENKLLFTIVFGGFLAFLFLGYFFLQNKKFNKKLKQEVAFQTEELAESNKQLEFANKELNEFNRILSHDLKEPLRSIVGFSSLLQNEISEKQNPKIEEYLSHIGKSGNQMHQLIDDVSKFQNIENVYDEDQELVDCGLVVESIKAANRGLIKENNVQIIYEDLPKMHTNQTMLFLILKNLIENGIKFNNSIKPTIQISTIEDKDQIHFDVKDNGIGIDPKFHQSMFDMFKRLHDRRAYHGSGLGLSIVKKLVNKLDGEISILSSKKDIGTLIRFSLPLNRSMDKYAFPIDL